MPLEGYKSITIKDKTHEELGELGEKLKQSRSSIVEDLVEQKHKKEVS